MHEIAKAIDHPATLAMSYLNIGTELERIGQQEEAIEALEQARDEAFRASKHVMVITNAYLARAYASAGEKVKFKRAIDIAIRIARDIEMFYGDGTDFVFHALKGSIEFLMEQELASAALPSVQLLVSDLALLHPE
jgi:tetratricopeptide (TPR) repeat protein